jgi:hypothetical protein
MARMASFEDSVSSAAIPTHRYTQLVQWYKDYCNSGSLTSGEGLYERDMAVHKSLPLPAKSVVRCPLSVLEPWRILGRSNSTTPDGSNVAQTWLELAL